LDANNQRLSEQISEIDLTDPQDARVLMPEQGRDILGHFGEDRFLERYQRYKAHIAEWRQQYPKLAAVDLRYDSQVVLETGAVSAMSQKQDNLIVVLDIGSAHTRVLAADLNEGALRYRGHGIVESAGMRKGLISDLAPARKAVKAANEQAERMARANIDECVVGVGGPHIRGINTNGGFELGSRMREITRDDVRTAVERARAVERPPDREILHLLPRQFILDGSRESSIPSAWWARGLKSICTSPPAPAARCKARSPAPTARGLK
jgi:hypothetical protein